MKGKWFVAFTSLVVVMTMGMTLAGCNNESEESYDTNDWRIEDGECKTSIL